MARVAKRYSHSVNIASKSGIPVFYVGIYSRLSVEHYDRKSESIENQLIIIKQFIKKNNQNPNKNMELIVYDTYLDKGKTGTNFERIGFKQMLNDVRNGSVTCIIVKDFSRFGRDYIETGNYIEKILPFLGVRFISVSDGYDSMSEEAANGKFAMHIKNLVNDMYVKDISERVALSKKISREAGSFAGSVAPYGYKVERIADNRRLVVDREPAAIVKWIYEEFAADSSLDLICSKLYLLKVHRISDYNAYGHVYMEDGEVLHQWNKDVIKHLVKNQVYIGILTQGKHLSKQYAGKKVVVLTKPEAWVVSKEAHEPIIPQKLFAAANLKMEHLILGNACIPKNRLPAKSSEYEHVFQNVIFCADCGKKLKGVYYQSRITGERHYSYYCQGTYYQDYRKCSKKFITEKQLIVIMHDTIRECLIKAGLKWQDVTKMNADKSNSYCKQYEQEKNQIQRQLQAIKKSSFDILIKYKEGNIKGKEYDVFRNAKEKNVKFLSNRLLELNKKQNQSLFQANEENKFLRSLFKMDGSEGLNIILVEALVDQISLHSDGSLDIRVKFGGDSVGK